MESPLFPVRPRAKCFFDPQRSMANPADLLVGWHTPQRFPSASQGIDLKQRENLRASTVEGVRLGLSRSPRVQRHGFSFTFRPHPF